MLTTSASGVGSLHGLHIGPQGRRFRCLRARSPPTPLAEVPRGAARRERRARPTPTPVLAPALVCLA